MSSAAGEGDAARPTPPALSGLVLGAHWGFLAFLIGLAGYHVVGAVVALVVTGSYGGPGLLSLPEVGPFLLLTFLPTVALGVAPVLGSLRWGRGLRADFGLVPSRRDLKVGVGCGIVALAVGYVLNLVLMAIYGEERLSGERLSEVMDSLGTSVLWLLLAVVVMVGLAPFAEELLMRGALWSGLEHHRVPPWVILALTSVVFAYLHADAGRTVALIGQGVAFGAARMITGKTSASVVAHATNNLPPAMVLLVGAW